MALSVALPRCDWVWPDWLNVSWLSVFFPLWIHLNPSQCLPSANIWIVLRTHSLVCAWGVQPYTGICCLVAGEACGFRLGLPSLPLCLPGNEALSLFTRILSRHAEMVRLWLVSVSICRLEDLYGCTMMRTEGVLHFANVFLFFYLCKSFG